ncbi:MAG: hypothetical protein ACNFW9_04725 [Candidatus Kerfeldbacteria bacterium]
MLIITLVIGAGLILSGCGVAEKVAENTIESATNNEIDVDIDDNSLTLNTNGGTLEVGEKVSMPNNFPSDIYVLNGNLISAMTIDENNTFSINLSTNDSPTEVKAEYQTELANDGWTIDSTLDFGGGSMMTGTKDNRSITVTISVDETEGTTTVGINTFDIE